MTSEKLIKVYERNML